MEKLIYIDTCVYLDHINGRKDRLRDLGDFAFLLFQRAVNCEFKIVISDWVLTELRKHTVEEQIELLLKWFQEKDKLVFVSKTKEDIKKARELSEEYQDDALHAILAKKAGAFCVITRNLSHYAGMEPLIKVVLPENV